MYKQGLYIDKFEKLKGHCLKCPNHKLCGMDFERFKKVVKNVERLKYEVSQSKM